jgi:cellulose synthase/poly-beta-1,6-N-acetylglucosamine synthase-like glycosyltransferase
VLRTKKKEQYINKLQSIIDNPIDPEELPNVTVLIPTYNESETIYAKIKNIREFDYPLRKVEILVLDDSSIDNTREIASSAFREFNIRGRLIVNDVRSGVNVSYNRAIPQVNSEYILTTDADALIPPDSLLKAVKVLIELTEVGGVAAKMIPLSNTTNTATRTAIAYADSYNSMLTAESAIFSTFPGSTSCMLMRKSAFSPISTSYGSSDGNMSLSIIKNGFKFILAPCITYYEPISQRLLEQRRQKTRRATRLLQSTLLNLDILFNRKYKEFGKTIFPLRFLMMMLCPILAAFSILLFFIFVFINSMPLFAILLACAALVFGLGAKTNIKAFNLIMSFLIHQAYLFAGILLSFRKMNVWKKIERKSAN